MKKAHKIQTLCFDTQVQDEAMANAFADLLRLIDCEQLLAKVLRRYDDLPDWVRIDSLEIDIGDVDLGEGLALKERISEQLAEALGRQLPVKRMRNAGIFFDPAESPDRQDPEEQEIEVLLYFLSNGSLPWYVSDAPDMEVVLLKIIEESKPMARIKLLDALKHGNVARRLATNFSIGANMQLMDWLAVPGDLSLTSVEAALFGNDGLRKLSRERALAFIFLQAKGRAYSANLVFNTVVTEALREAILGWPVEERHSIVASASEVTRQGAAEEALLVLIRKLSVVLVVPPDPGISAGNLGIEPVAGTGKQQQSAGQEKKRPENALADSAEETGESYFIDNSGLVLLNASLIRGCFEKMGWVKEKRFVDAGSRDKAVLWLDRLVWGNEKVHEYRLTLNKVLAGLHPSAICDTGLHLSEGELHMADQLLMDVIGHWEIIGNTRLETFRESFLQRPGRLKSEDGGWQLHASSKGYDILIDSLPWSFSIIKFPWMDKPLYTQWQTKV